MKPLKHKTLSNSFKMIPTDLINYVIQKEETYPNNSGKSYSYALNQFVQYFDLFKDGKIEKKTISYFSKAWQWDYRKTIRFIVYCTEKLQSFWNKRSDTLKKFIERSKQILHKQKAYVYKARGKEITSVPEQTKKELEELFAEAMAQNAKNQTIYKNFILKQLSNNDKMTVDNFNAWLKEQEAIKTKKELQNKINNFDYRRLVGKPLVLSCGDVIITDIEHIAQDYVVVGLANGTTKELPKIGILKSFGLLAA